MTLTQRIMQMEWWFYEKGGQSLWNELRRVTASTLGSGFTGKPAGVTLLGDIDLTLTTHLSANAAVPNTGAPIPAGGQAPGWGSGQQHVPGTPIDPPTLDNP